MDGIWIGYVPSCTKFTHWVSVRGVPILQQARHRCERSVSFCSKSIESLADAVVDGGLIT